MRPRVALVVVMALVALGGAFSICPVVANGASASCPPAGSSLVARSSVGAVYRAEKDDDVVYGCLRRTRREVVLPGGENEYTSVRIAGRFVAARDHWDSGAPDPCYGIAVAVMDLRARPDAENQLGQRYREARGSCEGSEPLDLPTSIVLKRNGAVAYLRCDASYELGFGGPYRCLPDATRIVVKHDARDARNAFEVLDRSPSIASLKLRGGTLSWRDGTQPRTARLK